VYSQRLNIRESGGFELALNTTTDIENLLSRLTLGDRKAFAQLYDKTSG
jgi:hypothetical protein